MRKILTLVSFFLFTPLFLLASTLVLSYHSYQSNALSGVLLKEGSEVAYAALPSTTNVVEASAQFNDRRVQNLQSFFKIYNSPLYEYAQYIIDKADAYGIDYRYLPAIAAQESLLCKKELPHTHNCWGYGIYGKKVMSFDSYDQAIDTISHYFANKKANGIDTLDAIGNLYNPGNVNDWKGKVQYFMNQL